MLDLAVLGDLSAIPFEYLPKLELQTEFDNYPVFMYQGQSIPLTPETFSLRHTALAIELSKSFYDIPDVIKSLMDIGQVKFIIQTFFELIKNDSNLPIEIKQKIQMQLNRLITRIDSVPGIHIINEKLRLAKMNKDVKEMSKLRQQKHDLLASFKPSQYIMLDEIIGELRAISNEIKAVSLHKI